MASFCTITNDPTTFIEVIHLNRDEASRKGLIEAFVQYYRDSGFEIINLDFMEYEYTSPIGPVQLALVDMRHVSLDQSLYLVLWTNQINNGQIAV